MKYKDYDSIQQRHDALRTEQVQREWDESLNGYITAKARWCEKYGSIETLEHFVRSIGESGYASPYDNRTKLVYTLLERLKQIVK